MPPSIIAKHVSAARNIARKAEVGLILSFFNRRTAAVDIRILRKKLKINLRMNILQGIGRKIIAVDNRD